MSVVIFFVRELQKRQKSESKTRVHMDVAIQIEHTESNVLAYQTEKITVAGKMWCHYHRVS